MTTGIPDFRNTWANFFLSLKLNGRVAECPEHQPFELSILHPFGTYTVLYFVLIAGNGGVKRGLHANGAQVCQAFVRLCLFWVLRAFGLHPSSAECVRQDMQSLLFLQDVSWLATFFDLAWGE